MRVESVRGSHPRRCRGDPAATRTVGEVTRGRPPVAPVLRGRGAAHAVERRRHPPRGPRSDRAPLSRPAGRAAGRSGVYRHRHVPRARPAEQPVCPRADPARDPARRPGRARAPQPAAVPDRAVRHLQNGRHRGPGEPALPRRRPRASAPRLRRAGRRHAHAAPPADRRDPRPHGARACRADESLRLLPAAVADPLHGRTRAPRGRCDAAAETRSPGAGSSPGNPRSRRRSRWPRTRSPCSSTPAAPRACRAGRCCPTTTSS